MRQKMKEIMGFPTPYKLPRINLLNFSFLQGLQCKNMGFPKKFLEEKNCNRLRKHAEPRNKYRHYKSDGILIKVHS